MMDITDGLSMDLRRICVQSGVGAMIDAKAVPISFAAFQSSGPLGAALNDGEDFELLFTLAAGEYDKLVDAWDMDTPTTKVGVITDSGKIELRSPDGGVEQMEPKGFDHL